MTTLAEGIAALGFELPEGAGDKLAAFLDLLEKWNRVYNLTAVRDPRAMVTHHLLDSLAVVPILDAFSGSLPKQEKSAPAGRRFTLVDVGSGAGLPGLVLAIARPKWALTLVETVEKKAAFQRQAAIALALANVSIHCGRSEALRGEYDSVIARALAGLPALVGLAGHLAHHLWAMKGAYPADEIAGLPAGWRVAACHPLRVPGLSAERCLVHLERD